MIILTICILIMIPISGHTSDIDNLRPKLETGTITETLFDIVQATQKESANIKIIALEIMAGMFAIALLWLFIKAFIGRGNTSQELIGMVMTLAIYTIIIAQGPSFIVSLFKAFGNFGLIAGGNNISEELLLNPSAILAKGYNALGPIIKNLSWHNTIRTFIHPFKAIGGLCAYLSVLITHVLIAINMFLIIAEYFIYASVALILLPGAMTKPTNYLASNAVKGYFTLAARYMAHAMVLSLMYGVFDIIKLPNDPFEIDVWHMVFQTWFLLAVIIFVPSSIAKTVSGGAPELSTGLVLGGLFGTAAASYMAVKNVGTLSYKAGAAVYSGKLKKHPDEWWST